MVHTAVGRPEGNPVIHNIVNGEDEESRSSQNTALAYRCRRQ